MKRLCPKLFRLCCLVAVVLFNGCGYHFTGEGPGPRPGLTKIAVPLFENKTSEPELESLFATALRKEFLQKGSMQVVPVDQAEAIFRGTVKSISTSAVSHLEVEKTIESRLYVTLDIRCEDARDGTILWQDRNFTYYKVFLQYLSPKNPNPIIGYESRRAALEFLAGEMSVRIHDRFLNSF
ncbi:MAG TPA: LPS assembly lipoprotein LptE [Syntrophobacteraceae bacterium]|nr:LPS assembly lipoprotein LptE [Syntrophobacteraceae bacterium]